MNALEVLSSKLVDSQQLLSLPSEDVAFLASKGCLSLPASDAIDEFARL
jgi:hypothetical protein